MGFSKDCFEQYRREIRIMWRVLAVGSLIAAGFHVYSVPLVARFASRMLGPLGTAPEFESTPIEVVVVEEEVSQPPLEEEPEEEPPDEPAASAEQPSAPPQATTAEPIPTNVRSADTIQTEAAIATTDGALDGQGAVGDSTAIGLVPGAGEPIESNAPQINLPNPARQPIQETPIARRRTTSRSVTCNPCSLPDYPLTERREQIEGQPVISVTYDESGQVIRAEIEVSSGNAAFDRAALDEALDKWRFSDSQGVGGQVSVDVTFVMEGSDQYAEAQQAGEIRSIELPLRQSSRQSTSAQGATVNQGARSLVALPRRSSDDVSTSSVSEDAPSESINGASENGVSEPLAGENLQSPPEPSAASSTSSEAGVVARPTGSVLPIDEPVGNAAENSITEPALSVAEPPVPVASPASAVRTPVPEVAKPVREADGLSE